MMWPAINKITAYTYIGNIMVCSHDKIDHDHNLKWFTAVIEKYNLTLNNDKCSYELNTVNLLPNVIS